MELNDPPSLIITAYPNNYNIYIGSYLQNNLALLLTSYLNQEAKVVVIYDKNIEQNYLPLLTTALSSIGINYFIVPFIAAENNKNLTETQKILNFILAKSINRKSTIIALGGGITGDLAGFIAAILLRGVNFINIPTTLLSGVDSSVGGKTGVNHKMGKNFIGTFYNPKAVIIDPLVFTSLNKRELLAGFAEVIKCALINNPKFFTYLYNNHQLLLEHNQKFLEYILQNAILTKKYLVEKDFLDLNNQRALLNLGHTFGHALELINGYKKSLLHGEAVAIGICLAAKFSSYMGYLEAKEANKIVNFFKAVKLPTAFKPLKNKAVQTKLVTAMLGDKKNNNQNINLVLLKAIGKAAFVLNIKPLQILNFLQQEYK